jgi:DNA mismatch repair protein MLH3
LERGIPTMPPPTQSRSRMLGLSSSCFERHSLGADARQTTLDRSVLENARVLAQVDRKFIICSIDDGKLIIIDQHAASERVRVERFLSELCTMFLKGCDRNGRTELRPAMPVLLTVYESGILWASFGAMELLEKWGFTFEPRATQTVNEENCAKNVYEQLIVRCVPSVVSEKVSMHDLIRY